MLAYRDEARRTLFLPEATFPVLEPNSNNSKFAVRIMPSPHFSHYGL
jgi:hypothetical protein